MKKNEKNFILISGPKAAGKSIIRGIIDGHPDIFVSPFHELILQAFDSEDPDQAKAFKARDIEYVRTRLSCVSKYFSLERLSLSKYSYTHISAMEEDVAVPLSFDFYKFDRDWVSELLGFKTEWSVYTICRILYTHFDKNLNNTGPFKEKIYYSALSDGYAGTPLKFIKNFPKAKIIFVKRDIVELLSALVGRQPRSVDLYRSEGFKRDLLAKEYVSESFILETKKLYLEIDILKKIHKDNILILNFNELFNDSQKVKQEILDFLNLDEHEILNHYSVLGSVIERPNGVSMLSKSIDTGSGNLKEDEIERVKEIWN